MQVAAAIVATALTLASCACWRLALPLELPPAWIRRST